MQTYKYTYSITLGDIDSDYRITPSTILCYFQDTIARFLSLGHVGPLDIKADNLIWMITDFDAHIAKDKPSWTKQTIVEVCVSELTLLKVFVDFKMYNEENHEFATGTSAWVMFDFIHNKPFPCHNNEHLVKLHDIGDAIKHKKQNIPQSGELIRTIQHHINATEVDFNGHTNNQNYFKIATSLIPSNYVKNYFISNMTIKFTQQTFCNDVLDFSLTKHTDETFSVSVTKDNGASAICKILTKWEKL